MTMYQIPRSNVRTPTDPLRLLREKRGSQLIRKVVPRRTTNQLHSLDSFTPSKPQNSLLQPKAPERKPMQVIDVTAFPGYPATLIVGIDSNNIHDRYQYGRTALHIAVLNQATPIAVKHLLSLKTEVNAIDVQGNTALHLAALKWTYSFKTAIELIKHGADKGIRNMNGKTAFQLFKDAKDGASIEVRNKKRGSLLNWLRLLK